jgi:hypothetical protein
VTGRGVRKVIVMMEISQMIVHARAGEAGEVTAAMEIAFLIC